MLFIKHQYRTFRRSSEGHLSANNEKRLVFDFEFIITDK